MSDELPSPPSNDQVLGNVFNTRRNRKSIQRKSVINFSGDVVTEEIEDKWATAIQSLDTSGLVKMMIETVSQMPYRTKKELKVSGDHQVVQKILSQMNDLLDQKFLHIDFDSSSRDVQNKDWTKIVSCRRSDSGTTGIYFIQSKISKSSDEYEIIVAKPLSKDDYERQLFVNELTTQFFHIHCPKIRYIAKSDAEFNDIETNLKNIFLPFHLDLYDSAGSSSPKNLFSSQGILLMELVKGKPLCHRTQGQRQLQDEDYRAIGRLFLLDLIIRNTDRLPCRKAMPRPGSVAILDQGNAGNLMFGDIPGSLWAIDPEMQTQINLNKESDYKLSLESVVYEIIHDERSLLRYTQLENLFFLPVHGLTGILDTSLDELTPWFSNETSALQSDAISSILNLIRVRAQAEDGAIIKRSLRSPPTTNSEREWREWIRLSTPRAINDILKFVEYQTGYSVPITAAHKFSQGFSEALSGALNFLKEVKNPLGSFAVKHPTLLRIILSSNQIDVSFIIRMIEHFTEYENRLSYGEPSSTCDATSSAISPLKLRFINAAMRAVSLKSDLA